MIDALMEDPGISGRFASNGRVIRKKGYPMVEEHNFLYLANEIRRQG